jgi:hypothetical protein
MSFARCDLAKEPALEHVVSGTISRVKNDRLVGRSKRSVSKTVFVCCAVVTPSEPSYCLSFKVTLIATGEGGKLPIRI